MSDLLSKIHEVKQYVGAAGVLVAFIVDRKLGPAEDDLPMRFKIILAAPVIVAIVCAQSVPANQRLMYTICVFGLWIVSTAIYMSIWSIFGYKKTTSSPRPWWNPWGEAYRYRTSRVMGGALQPSAKSQIAAEKIPSIQDYFEGVEFKQDVVWTRKSRAALQVILFLSYVFVTLFYTATFAIAIS